MSLNNMQVFNQFLYDTVTETIRQQINLFNGASSNALQLRTASNVGDTAHEITYKLIQGMMRRRDAYGGGDINHTTLQQMDHVAIKIAGGTAPIDFEPQQFSWIQLNPEEAGVVIGEQLAAGILADELNTSILGLVTAINANTGVIYDGKASTLTLNALNKGAAKFGDRSGDLAVWIMHSTPAHDLYDTALTNANRLFQFGTVRVLEDGLGRRFVVTDSPALINIGTDPDPNTYNTLGLVSGAAIAEDNGDYYATLQEQTGKENIQRTFQAEYTFNLKLKGYSWATSVKSPNNAAIGSAANWSKIATDNKDTAGVLVMSK